MKDETKNDTATSDVATEEPAVVNDFSDLVRKLKAVSDKKIPEADKRLQWLDIFNGISGSKS